MRTIVRVHFFSCVSTTTTTTIYIHLLWIKIIHNNWIYPFFLSWCGFCRWTLVRFWLLFCFRLIRWSVCCVILEYLESRILKNGFRLSELFGVIFAENRFRLVWLGERAVCGDGVRFLMSEHWIGNVLNRLINTQITPIAQQNCQRNRFLQSRRGFFIQVLERGEKNIQCKYHQS